MAAFIEHRTTQDSAVSNNCQVKWKLVRRSLMKRIKKGFSAWSSHKHTRLHPLVLSGPPLLPPLSSHLTLVSMVTQNPLAAVRPVKCSAISSLPCSFEPTTGGSQFPRFFSEGSRKVSKERRALRRGLVLAGPPHGLLLGPVGRRLSCPPPS